MRALLARSDARRRLGLVPLALPLALVCALTPLGAQTSARDSVLRTLPPASVRVRPAGRADRFFGVHVTLPSAKAVRVHLNTASHAFSVDSARVVSASRRGTRTYLLLDVHGPSRAPRSDGRGYCGAGDERGLVALELDRARTSAAPRVVRTQGVLYESCWYSVMPAYPDSTYRMTADSVWGSWTPYVRDSTRHGDERPMRYLTRAPERGLHEVGPKSQDGRR
jgi:hypothetical protein